MEYYKITNDSELYHHGILGQKLGVRRYQNKDGSLTEAGRKRAIKDSNNSWGKSLNQPSSPKSSILAGLTAATGNKMLEKELSKSDDSDAVRWIAAHYASNTPISSIYNLSSTISKEKVKELIDRLETDKELSSKLTSNDVKSKVDRAKETGMFDMEFLERNLDVNPKTGENLEGKALYDAYEKYLKEEHK